MPETPHPPSRPDAPVTPRAGRPSALTERGANYAELRCRSNFTFLEGASHPDELVETAAALGYAGLAVTDVNTLAGVVRAHVAAKRVGLPLLVGAEVVCRDAPPCVLLAETRAGYANLSRLLTAGRRRAPKGACDLRFSDVAAHAAGLCCGVTLTLDRESREETTTPADFRDAFPGRCWGLVELSRGPEDRRALAEQLAAANAARLPPVAAGGVLYHAPDRRFLHDVLTATRLGRPVSELVAELAPNGERHLKDRGDLLRTFHGRADLLDRTVEIAERCRFNLDELRYEYPEEIVPKGETPMGYLARLTWAGAEKRYPRDRYPRGVPDAVKTALGHELWLIEKLNYAAYFLTVYDLVRFARSRGILCQGRGSAANSAVCYCLGVTAVDPAEHHLFFERFLSEERNEPPDIDVDFEHERREEVIQYLYQKYGRERAGIAATVITYRPRSAIRDVGKALGLSLDRVDALAKSIGRYGEEGCGEKLKTRFREAAFDPDTRLAQQLITLVRQLLGFPRHLSQHSGGMVMTRGRLDELVPVENASMTDRTVVQWDKDDLEALGLLKVDVLALGMLTAIQKCFRLLDVHRLAPELRRSASPARHAEAPRDLGVTGANVLDLADIPIDDADTYRMIRRAETAGVFQIESRAQRATLPRTRPERYYDLVIEVALIRPGPIQGGMVHPYIRRRRGEEDVTYPDDRVKAVLERTLGVPIFQEQCMKLAEVAAGFSPGEADQLRRALAGWRKSGRDIGDFERKLKDGLRANGYERDFADRLFAQIQGFGEYGFPESHAASFACLVVVSCYLKCRHPAAFFAAILNSQPMGFYQPAQLVKEAKRQGVIVRPACVNASDWDCTLEDRNKEGHVSGGPLPERPALRLGLRQIAGLREVHAEAISRARAAGGAFVSVADCARRAGLPRTACDRLAGAGAFASLGLARRQARWHALPDRTAAPLPDAAGLEVEPSDPTPALPNFTPHQTVIEDYARTGLSLNGHPMAAVRDQLKTRGVLPCRRLGGLADGTTATVAGLVLMRQRPGSAKGVTFVTIEDETGETNLVLWPSVWEAFHRPARTAGALLVTGAVQRDDSRKTLHLVVSRLTDLREALRSGPADAALDGARLRSRDFH
ncbi:error-prone DNA polymerase [Alienimonas californiensis]|uniref:Error-prone DNA polymerase n=1 Tax=Alienimonas californiensis TaxID=2527989 RepID=A0A517P6J9_9PLAN|nr:error-prone DNA polymerase [Alienimonas californiensis]QDT14999.1 Error-prone DNA polymerase [Alienimonas californiensis]